MANPMRGEVGLPVGDQTYKLCFDINAMCCAEGALNKTTDQIIGMVEANFAGWVSTGKPNAPTPRVNTTLTRALLWAGLQRHYPNTHLIEAGEIMAEAGIGPSAVAILNGFYAALGQSQEGGDKPRPPKPAGKKKPTG